MLKIGAIACALLVGLTAGTVSAKGHAHSYHAPRSTSHSYYTNVSGHRVHSPSSSRAGASAQCRDGSYSYSEHHSGTCSHHGGVSTWY